MAYRRSAAVAALFFAAFVMPSATPAAVETRRGDNVYVGGSTVAVTGDIKGDVMAGGASVDVNVISAEHVAAAGGHVTIGGTVRDGVWAAGGDVVIDANIGHGLMAAGANVDVGGRIAEDAYLAGSNVTVSGTIGDDLFAAGGNVTLAQDGTVGGKMNAAGAHVTVAGSVSGDLEAAGEAVVISGRIDGNAEIEARELRLDSGAVIAGNLDYRGPSAPQIDAMAAIGGEIRTTAVDAGDDPRIYPMRSWPQETFEGPGIAGSIVFAIAAFVSGVIFFLVFPRFVGRAARAATSRLGGSILGGILTFILLPFAAILLMITIIGIPLGLMTLLLYPVLLLASYFIAGFGIAEWLLNRSGAALSKGQRILHYVVGILVLFVVGLIPFLGPLLVLLALLIGLGAFMIAVFGKTEPATA